MSRIKQAFRRFALRPEMRSLVAVASRTPREEMLWRAFEFISANAVPGDYVEFGLYRGGTFVPAHRLAERHRPEMRLFGFDSFEGLPEPGAADKGGQFSDGMYSCSKEEFERILRSANILPESVTLIEGWFNRSIAGREPADFGIGEIALANIDCDLYESTVPVLDFLAPGLQQGTILLFDDWNCFRASGGHGQRLAVSEWLERNPDLGIETWHPYGWHGQSFICQRGS